MKKILAILIMLVYLPAIAGVGFSTHFCAGKVKSTTVFSFSNHSCCSDKEEQNGCCSNQLKIVKLEKDQLSSSFRFPVKQLSQLVFIPSSVVDLPEFKACSLKARTDQFYSPPLFPQDFSVLYCTYLI